MSQQRDGTRRAGAYLLFPLIISMTLSVGCNPGHAGSGLKEYREISLSVRNCDQSRQFYEHLGFALSEDQRVVSSSSVLMSGLRLEECDSRPPQMIYVSSDSIRRSKRIRTAGEPIQQITELSGLRGYADTDPSGIRVIMCEGYHPADLWNHHPAHLPPPWAQVSFKGLLIYTNDLAHSSSFWVRHCDREEPEYHQLPMQLTYPLFGSSEPELHIEASMMTIYLHHSDRLQRPALLFEVERQGFDELKEVFPNLHVERGTGPDQLWATIYDPDGNAIVFASYVR